MKLIGNDFLILRKDFYDEDDDLITPQNMKRYQLGLFDHLLNSNEVSEYYSPDSIFSKNFSKYEVLFLNFLNEVFENSTEPIFIDFDIERLQNYQIIQILNDLDYEDKDIWIEFVKKLDNAKSKIIEVESATELKMFFKIVTRTVIFPFFHFENGKVILKGNFDLFFPMFFSTPELVNKYSLIANKNSLHILFCDKQNKKCLR